jgi:hypothetical protein
LHPAQTHLRICAIYNIDGSDSNIAFDSLNKISKHHLTREVSEAYFRLAAPIMPYGACTFAPAI